MPEVPQIVPIALSMLLLVVALTACAQTPTSTTDPVQMPSRGSPSSATGFNAMLKFRDPAVRLEEQVERLSRVAGVPVSLVRRMSGDAYVIRLAVPDDAAFRASLARLRVDPSVEYVEPDQRLRTQ